MRKAAGVLRLLRFLFYQPSRRPASAAMQPGCARAAPTASLLRTAGENVLTESVPRSWREVGQGVQI